jgi:small ligand-binding sensory domain FIST
VRSQLCRLFAWSAWAKPDTMVVGTTVEGAGLASVRLYGVGSVNVVADTTRKGAGLASVRLAGVGSVTVVAGR